MSTIDLKAIKNINKISEAYRPKIFDALLLKNASSDFFEINFFTISNIQPSLSQTAISICLKISNFETLGGKLTNKKMVVSSHFQTIHQSRTANYAHIDVADQSADRNISNVSMEQ